MGGESGHQLIDLYRRRRLPCQALLRRGYRQLQELALGRSGLQHSQAYVLRRADHRPPALSTNCLINEITRQPSRQTAIETVVNSRFRTIEIGPKKTGILNNQNLDTIPLDSRSFPLVVTTMKTLTLTTSLWLQLSSAGRPVARQISQDTSRRSRHHRTSLLDHHLPHPTLISERTHPKGPMQSRGHLQHRRAHTLAMSPGLAQNTVQVLELVKAVKAFRDRSVSVQTSHQLTTVSLRDLTVADFQASLVSSKVRRKPILLQTILERTESLQPPHAQRTRWKQSGPSLNSKRPRIRLLLSS